MADLIEKYFKGDLTEAEKTALDQELATSDEAANRFGELAEQAYRRFGLPEPQWAGPDKLRQKGHSDFMTWSWIFLLLAGIAGVSAFMYFLIKNTAHESPLSLTHSQRMDGLNSTLSVIDLQTQGQMASPVHSHPMIVAQAPSQNVSSTPAVSTTQAFAPQSPKFTPVNVDQNPNRPFSSLSIQLHLTAPRLLMVRILDSQGQELVPLFNGSLAAGNWSFEWNGKLKNGQLAPPGTYKIEVRAGAWSQTKEVIIQK